VKRAGPGAGILKRTGVRGDGGEEQIRIGLVMGQRATFISR